MSFAFVAVSDAWIQNCCRRGCRGNRPFTASGSTLHGFVVPQKLRHRHCAPCSNQCGSVRVLRFDSDRGVASKRQADGRITFVRKGHEDPTSFSGSPGCWYLALPANYQYDGTKPHRWRLATWPGVKSITYFDRRILHAAVRRDSAL